MGQYLVVRYLGECQVLPAAQQVRLFLVVAVLVMTTYFMMTVLFYSRNITDE